MIAIWTEPLDLSLIVFVPSILTYQLLKGIIIEIGELGRQIL